VDLRLTVTQEDGVAVIHVDGRLAAANLDDLEPMVAAIGGGVIIDLSNLISADDAGVATLRSLAGRGARLVGVTPYVALLLDDQRPPPGPGRKPRRLDGRP
jgi:anti-anti-sigma regulatory factor